MLCQLRPALSFIVGGSIIWLMVCCANPIPPTGGAKDTTPPRIVEEESTPNEQIGFAGRKIELTFNEWVELRDQATQVVISPPLQRPPQISLRGKTVVFEFDDDEELQDNTTYTINFGQAVRDITEGNAAEELLFVFSTGSFIDSLQLSGMVINASTGTPEAGAYVILHDNLSDTAMVKNNPSYFGQTGEDGTFMIRYIREDTFRVYGLRDENANYRYDQETELIGFLSDPVYIGPETSKEVEISVFASAPNVQILDVDAPRSGLVNLLMTHQVSDADVTVVPIEGDLPRLAGVSRDTVKIWHQYQDTTQLQISVAEEVIDTIRVNPFTQFEGKVAVRPQRRGILHPEDPFALIAGAPLAVVDSTYLQVVLGDSSTVNGCTLSIIGNTREIECQCTWKEDGRYEITLLPGAATDIYGNTNDTVVARVNVGERKSFGLIRVNTTALDSSEAYVIELMEGEQVERTERLPVNREMHIYEFAKLPAGSYVLRIVEDRNRNGRWDPGDLDQLQQPERVNIQILEELRAGWDLDVQIRWQEQ